ncbi:MAG: 4Fe-4S binding protein [Bacteroidales bacterium]|nr:4Fe-4S binding protein [Bacteroidales bacterium]
MAITEPVKIRQRIRSLILTISFIVFPVTMFWFSPVLIINGAADGILAGSATLFILLFFSSIFLGRAFCGWACPAGAIQEWLILVRPKRVSNKFNWIKWLIWVPWLSLIVYMFILAGGIKSIQPTYMIESGISIDEPFKYIIFFIFLLIFLILSVSIGRRASCHYICWMSPFMIIGNKISNIFNIPGLRISKDIDKCTDCGKCSESCMMSLDLKTSIKYKTVFNTECILCGHCVDNCETNALRFSFNKLKHLQ